jgi:hypothetical protein
VTTHGNQILVGRAKTPYKLRPSSGGYSLQRSSIYGLVVLACVLAGNRAARAQDNPSEPVVGTVQNQWFTGSLEAPSPALPKAGLVALEPYEVFINPTGAYDNDGQRYSVPNQASQFESLLVVKYGITDRLTFQALPSGSYVSGHQSDFAGADDLPLELEYRFNDGNKLTGWPSVTASLGVSLPTGDYQRLRSANDGLGSGAYMLKEGLLFQNLFEIPNIHPVRIRVYGAAFEPLDSANITGISTYGTDSTFRGRVKPGVSFQAGIGAGYAFTQRWVLALDVLRNYGRGFLATRVAAGDIVVRSRSVSTSSTAVAPALEYNWSGSVGVIAGVEFTTAGRNTGAYVSPQIALAISF